MIKADIVKKIAADLNIRDGEALVVTDSILEGMKDVICSDGRLEIRDFGVFKIKARKPRMGRNPKDKRQYPIAERKVVTFKIGKELRDQSVVGSSGSTGSGGS